MDLFDVSCRIETLLRINRTVYLRTDPEVPDFTDASSFKILIFGSKHKVELEVTPQNVLNIGATLDWSVFCPDLVDRCYVWNLKSLCSYFRYFTSKYLTPANSVIDLKVIESFLNIRKNPPENLVEAVNRTKIVVQQKGWNKVYKSIHMPLMLRVLPTIETTPLLESETRRCVHPYYEIEGQINGRMNCLKRFSRSYLPHNLGPEQRKSLMPRGERMRFAYGDFRHCEVSVLQWLTGDEELKKILDSDDDFHSKIYEKITGDKCDTPNKRVMSKKMFLPVMFGCSYKTLATNLNLSEGVGRELHRRIVCGFPTAWAWMEGKQVEAKSGPVLDYFGRPRIFGEGEEYQVRNSVVQGVAATICQEKLIELHKELDGERASLVFSVHDGFGVVCSVAAAKETFSKMKQVMESESKVCPGLKMKTEIKFGAGLDNMKVFWK